MKEQKKENRTHQKTYSELIDDKLLQLGFVLLQLFPRRFELLLVLCFGSRDEGVNALIEDANLDRLLHLALLGLVILGLPVSQLTWRSHERDREHMVSDQLIDEYRRGKNKSLNFQTAWSE
jgi:hypothetical protein